MHHFSLCYLITRFSFVNAIIEYNTIMHTDNYCICYLYIGRLKSVIILNVENNVDSITISWSAPFSLDVSGVDPDIWYTVLISNVTDEDHPTTVPCTDCHNLTQTHYTFNPNLPNPCHNYTFTVIPQNGVGNGTWSESIMGYNVEGKVFRLLITSHARANYPIECLLVIPCSLIDQISYSKYYWLFLSILDPKMGRVMLGTCVYI